MTPSEIWRLLRTTLGVVVWLAALTLGLYALNVGKIAPIDGAAMIRDVALCQTADCADARETTLPIATEMEQVAGSATLHLRVTLPQQNWPDALSALYFPKFADSLSVTLNGQALFASPVDRHQWVTPLLISVPEGLAEGSPAILDLTLSGPAAEGLDLHPFFYGPPELLAGHFAWRQFMGPGLARFALGLVGVLCVTLLLAWAFQLQEREYLWLGLACAISGITLLHYGYGVGLENYRVWTLLWVLDVAVYVLLILMFLRALLGMSPHRIERALALLLLAIAATILLAPEGWAFELAMIGTVIVTVPLSLLTISTFVSNQSLLSGRDFAVLSVCFSLAVVLGLYETWMLATNSLARSAHLFHLMPLVMAPACIWLVLSRLSQSIRNYGQLTASLNATLASKSAELEASFAELVKIRHREAIAEERDRIMLELHDGIGGQLVGVLAYMDSKGVADIKIRRALEDALRDLALMLDSMENHDSVVTLLGMLRTRLEGLLTEHGIEFDWQVHAEPELQNPGPSQSLHLARVVQEAITNVIKHAGADTIRVFVDERQIRISDNGHGFDPEQQKATAHPAHGIANMQRRSAVIGARFGIETGSTGTTITLTLR